MPRSRNSRSAPRASSRRGGSRSAPEAGLVRIREPEELVAALPALLGFHPRASLVLASLSGPAGRTLGLVVRCDLPEPPRAETGSPPGPDPGSPPGRDAPQVVAERAVAALLRDRPSRAIVVVVADHEGAAPFGAAPTGDGPSAVRRWQAFADDVADRLATLGVEVHAALWASGTAAGESWACFGGCGCGGVVPATAATAMAANAAAGGTVVFADRSELGRLVAPVDGATLRRRERLLNRAVDRALDPDSAPRGAVTAEPGPTDPGPTDPAAGIAAVEAALAEAAAGRLRLDDRTVVRLAMALGVPAVRDDAIEAVAAQGGSGAGAAAAEQLWAALTRESPDPEAAEPATLLAVSALLRGDGALANVALERAEQAWPGHRFTRLLRAAAGMGLRPEEFRAALLGGVVGNA